MMMMIMIMLVQFAMIFFNNVLSNMQFISYITSYGLS